MPTPAVKKADKKGGKKKELPKELCECGVDTYQAKPKRKKVPAPIEHVPGCNYQRTTCEDYPSFPRCEVCQSPCAHCLGKYRWCPHCYQRQCLHRYKRVVHGRQAPVVNAGPSTGVPIPSKSSTTSARRSTAVSFVGGSTKPVRGS